MLAEGQGRWCDVVAQRVKKGLWVHKEWPSEFESDSVCVCGVCGVWCVVCVVCVLS